MFPARGLTDAEAAMRPRPWHFAASDAYTLAVLSWPAQDRARGTFVVLHGVQSHAGWYHGLGRRLAAAGFTSHFPDRRGSGANAGDRGHAPSARRLVADIAELLAAIRSDTPAGAPVVLTGISWGGKLAVVTAARHPELVDAIALICPGLSPRVGVSLGEKLGVAVALLSGRSQRRMFPIPLADPALFTDDADAQAFIAQDPLSLRHGTAGLLATSFFLDRMLDRSLRLVRQPSLLMLAGRDRIVENARTRAYFERVAAPAKSWIQYESACHTLEFERDPRRYADDLLRWVESQSGPS
jgi:acylglycerol lipase